MYEPKIILQGAPNARDLGGIETADGRCVKRGRLIRSGMLSRLTDADVEYLENLGLRTIVDFRTAAERAQKPDRVPKGAEHIICPMLEDKLEGISRDKPETEDEEAQRTVKMAHRLMERNPNGVEQMRSLYPVLVSVEHSVEHYRKFFEILLEHEEGALIYHCTMGKDRVGVATALILTALGVPRSIISADYMITAERCAPGTERLIESCRRYTDDPAVLDFIRKLDTVQPDYLDAAFQTIDERWGSLASFMQEQLGLDADKKEKLRRLFLEEK